MIDATSANGIKAILIWNFATKSYMARVYSLDRSSFKDYELRHYDLSITINDEDAFFYEDSMVLDHSPKTLGLT